MKCLGCIYIKTGFYSLLVGIAWLIFIEPACADSATIKARVRFSTQQVTQFKSTPEEQLELIGVLHNSWDAYLHLDKKAFLNYFTVDTIRMSQRFGHVQYGREQIASDLKDEWSYFERPHGEISEQIVISNLKIHTSEDQQSAWVRYEIDAVGGARWHYDDSAYVFELFKKVGKQWKIAYYTDSWGLDVGTRNDALPFEFDFVYPVKNLERAVAFYQRLLGSPISQTKHRATFQFMSGNFILDDGQFKVPAQPVSQLPNGYAIFYVNDLDTVVKRIGKDNLINKREDDYLKNGDDPYVVARDPDGNAFMLEQKVYNSLHNQQKAQVSISETPSNPSSKVSLIMSQAWLNMDSNTLQDYCSDTCVWFDDSFHKELGWIQYNNLSTMLLNNYWHFLDHNKHNILADEDISHMKVQEYDNFTLVSYQRSLVGKELHAFKLNSFVTQVFSKSNTNELTFISNNDSQQSQVKDLDYSGYPVLNLQNTARFYQQTLKLGVPYKDEDYRGFWGRGSVFGIYTANYKQDHIPRKDQANGYMSFWISSANNIYSYLKTQHVTFPVIEAINDDSGISSEPGYKEVVATDSEGNLVIFSEYSGRVK